MLELNQNSNRTLSEIDNGAVEERFQNHLAEIIRSIEDPNTAATAKRVMTITLTFSPSESRSGTNLDVAFKNKLPGALAVQTYMSLSANVESQGRTILVEPIQDELPLGKGAN